MTMGGKRGRKRGEAWAEVCEAWVKAVVNSMSNYLNTTQTDKSHGSCGSVVFPHKSAKCKTAIDVATIFTLEQV